MIEWSYNRTMHLITKENTFRICLTNECGQLLKCFCHCQKQKYMIKYVYLAFAIFWLASCATPQAVVRLKPLQSSNYFVNGSEVLSQENENMKVVVYPNYDKMDKISFAISVFNKTDTLKTFGSEMFSIYPLGFEQMNEYGNYNKISIDTIWADDPEEQILQNEMAKSRAVASERNVAAGFLAIALTAAVVTVIEKPIQNNKLNNNNNQCYNTNNFNYYPSDYQGQKFAFVDQAIDHLKQNSFRKNTVPTGQATGGSIFFKHIEFANSIMLRIKFEDNVFLFPFAQTRHR